MINYLNDCKDLKKLTMICVLYETGARVSEFINIKLVDLNLGENASVTLYGKGNKTRIVPISQELVRLINKYLKEVYINYGEDYLFYPTHKEKYFRNSINILNYYLATYNSEEDYIYNEEKEVNYSIFEHSTSNLPCLHSSAPVSMALHGLVYP